MDKENQQQQQQQQAATPENCRKKGAQLSGKKRKSPLPYFTFNPGMFDAPEWTYRQLQLLCVKLGIKANGKKAQLIEALEAWHKKQFDHTKRDWPGSNFTMLEIDVGSEENPKVPRKLLTPLIKKPRRNLDGTPISILSPRRPMGVAADPETPGVAPGQQKRRRSLSFSLFNGVKIIPNRYELAELHSMASPPGSPEPHWAPQALREIDEEE